MVILTVEKISEHRLGYGAKVDFPGALEKGQFVNNMLCSLNIVVWRRSVWCFSGCFCHYSHRETRNFYAKKQIRKNASVFFHFSHPPQAQSYASLGAFQAFYTLNLLSTNNKHMSKKRHPKNPHPPQKLRKKIHQSIFQIFFISIHFLCHVHIIHR